MTPSPAEYQLLRILRAATGHELAIAITVSGADTRIDIRYDHDRTGAGSGHTFDAEWGSIAAHH
jgi:hypothetical protein